MSSRSQLSLHHLVIPRGTHEVTAQQWAMARTPARDGHVRVHTEDSQLGVVGTWHNAILQGLPPMVKGLPFRTERACRGLVFSAQRPTGQRPDLASLWKAERAQEYVALGCADRAPPGPRWPAPAAALGSAEMSASAQHRLVAGELGSAPTEMGSGGKGSKRAWRCSPGSLSLRRARTTGSAASFRARSVCRWCGGASAKARRPSKAIRADRIGWGPGRHHSRRHGLSLPRSQMQGPRRSTLALV